LPKEGKNPVARVSDWKTSNSTASYRFVTSKMAQLPYFVAHLAHIAGNVELDTKMGFAT
jgi:hypothetical protein